MGGADPIAVIEAAYRVEVSEAEWLAGIAEAALPLFRGGLGAVAYTYDASRVERMRVLRVATYGAPPQMTPEFVARIVEGTDADYVRNSYRSKACALMTETPGFERQSGPTTLLRSGGVVDVIGVNGTDASGVGCWVGAALPQATRLSGRERETFSRIAAHCAAGLRVRRALGAALGSAAEPTASAEAVLDASGRIEHATGGAEPQAARQSLREAALAMDRARGRRRHREPERAVEEWKGLVAGRWTLLDHFESDGRRYVLARRNEPGGSPLDKLTARERQVLGYLALGHSQKLIAYELGISPSTVGALVWRAARKLGVSSRDELRRIAASSGSTPCK